MGANWMSMDRISGHMELTLSHRVSEETLLETRAPSMGEYDRAETAR
jgi:hypothetical protein